jgi:hypothetical protein
MQISRHLLLAFAVGACLTPALVRAFDNEAQIRARQALEEKMRQLDAQSAAPTNPAPAKPAPKSAPAKPAPPVAKETPPAQPAPQKPQSATPAPGYVSTPSNDAATSEKLANALHQKMQEVGSETPAPPVVAQKPAKPAKAPQPPSVPSAPKPVAAKPAPTPAPASAPATANYAPLPQGTTTHPALLEQPTPQPSAAMNSQEPAQPSMSLPALTGPASSLSAAKQQKLDQLLQQYRADQLTPQQYHEQRAKVLAEP